MAEIMKHQPGQPDYGHNNPTGGTQENEGNLNPQGPTSGTENYHPDRKGGKQSGAHSDSTENPEDASSDQQSLAHADAELSDSQLEISRDTDRLYDEPGMRSIDEIARGRMQVAIDEPEAA